MNHGHRNGNWTYRPPRHQPRGGGARLTRTLVIVAGVAIATAMFVMIVALHSDSPDSSQAVRSDDSATVTSNEERAAIAELEAKARSQKPPEIKSVPLPSPTLTRQAPAVPLPARPPSRLAELQEEEYVKALSAPPMVEAFHHGETLEVPSVASQAGTTRPYGLTITPSSQSNGTCASSICDCAGNRGEELCADRTSSAFFVRQVISNCVRATHASRSSEPLTDSQFLDAARSLHCRSGPREATKAGARCAAEPKCTT